jgi:hypothetical protein
MPRGQYKKRGIEPYEICERKGRIFLSGYIFSLFTLSNNQPLWRTYLLSNMKDVRQIKRKYPRVVRPLWKGGTFKGAKVLVSISNYFKTSKVKGKTKDEVDANNELPDEKRVKNVYQKLKKSVYQPPNEDSEEGDFDD